MQKLTDHKRYERLLAAVQNGDIDRRSLLRIIGATADFTDPGVRRALLSSMAVLSGRFFDKAWEEVSGFLEIAAREGLNLRELNEDAPIDSMLTATR